MFDSTAFRVVIGEDSTLRWTGFYVQPSLSRIFSYFICHLQGFGAYCFALQFVIGLQIHLADGLQIPYLQAICEEVCVYKINLFIYINTWFISLNTLFSCH